MIKYGKPSAPLFDYKKAYFLENDAILADYARITQVYVQQPRRMQCKNCLNPLGDATFEKFGVEYVICSRCGHLNGAYEDTDTFCAALYTKEGGKTYGAVYESADVSAYQKRVNDIYLPKARFLSTTLNQQGEVLSQLGFADIGAGSGYFLAALLDEGVTTVQGFEVAASQVNLANTMLGKDLVTQHGLADVVDIATSVNANVVSLIGVLEHLQEPRDLLRVLSDNSNVEYLFLSLPLFSPCVFFEMIFPRVMPRQLVGAHTHLYTESSIDYLCGEYRFERVGEWWFGTDLVDLYRSVTIELEISQKTSYLIETWEKMFKPAIDDMQLALDKRRLSSEVHLVLRKRK